MRRHGVWAGALALAVIGAACSGDSTNTTSTSGVATTAATASSARQEPTTTPVGGSQPPANAPATTAPATAASPTAGGGEVTTAKLNLNTATAEQFKTIPGVGDRFVREFNEYRPYTSILQFRREIGKYVAGDQVAQWERFVFVPVTPNSADEATLQQLPGVTTGIAQQLTSARPYASTDAFLAKLGTLVSATQATAARAYLAAP